MEVEKQMESKLEKEGWSLLGQVVKQTLEQLLQSGGGEEDRRNLEGALRTELLDTDIRRIGARSLPDLQTLLHTRVLQGLRVLQILLVNDISQSSKRATVGGNQQSRLLKFRFTDGHTTVTAIEFRPIPSVSQDLPPGTKVVLGNAVPVRTGVLLLDVNCIRVLGGHVQAMYDAWEMDRKYSGVAREAASKSSLSEGVPGPPPFRALQLGRKTRPGNVPVLQTAKLDLNSRTGVLDNRAQTAKGSVPAGQVVLTQIKKEDVPSKPKPIIRPGAEPYRPRIGGAVKDISSSGQSSSIEGTPLPPSAEISGARPESTLHLQRTEEISDDRSIPAGQGSGLQPDVSAHTPSTGSVEMKTDHRPKHIDQNIKDVISLGIDDAPLQNRKASQKLLEKSVDTDWRRGGGRGAEGRRRGGRRGGLGGREREDEASLLTLDEWEARKSSGNSSNRDANTNRPEGSHATDEEFAWRLQQQLDLESSQGGPSKENDHAEQLRASMFSFTPPAVDEDSRGRGRGRGRSFA